MNNLDHHISGTPGHFHALTFNLVAKGRKEWWVAPIQQSFYSNEPGATRKQRLQSQASCTAAAAAAADDDDDHTPDDDDQQQQGGGQHFTAFTQHAMDIVVRIPCLLFDRQCVCLLKRIVFRQVIPTDVAHTTVNVEYTVGFAIEVTHLPSSPW